MGKTTLQNQSASSYSAHEEGHMQDTKAALYLRNPELSNNASRAEIGQPIFPYAYPDSNFGGFYTAYGPHNMIQQQVMVPTAGRIPLPADISEDCPIYVNAKQYHGILRRRQTRAKLEAKNKLVRNRKPYLHESRHQHALNRSRGNGGRFVSTKKSENSDLVPSSHSMGNDQNPFLRNVADVAQEDGSHGVQGGGFAYNGNRHYASVVR